MTREQLPKLYKSALISLGGFAIAVGVFFAVKYLFPNQDLSSIELAVVASIGAWLVNFVKEALK